MNEHWFNFIVVITVQFIFFCIHYYFAKDKLPMTTYLWKGMLLGLQFGFAFDLIVGKSIGMFTYQLGFQTAFLLLNDTLSYGFWIANVFLLHDHSVKHMMIWSVLLGLVYEVNNFFFPVWQWTFADPLIEYLLVIVFAYGAFALLMMLMLRLIYKSHFKLVPF